MAGNHKKRKRQINIEKLNIDQADQLAAQIGQEVAKIMDEANKKCNKLLNIYSLQTSIGYEIVKKESKKAKINKKQEK
jgi:hypothetical protein